MSGTTTFSIIKPGAVAKNKIGAILHIICEHGFKIKAMKFIQLTPEIASKFYAVHYGQPFFEGLINSMTSGPLVVMILEKENAVEDLRTLVGATNPESAAEGTIRRLFAESTQKNAIHGSDSDENAARESRFFFSEYECF